MLQLLTGTSHGALEEVAVSKRVRFSGEFGHHHSFRVMSSRTPKRHRHDSEEEEEPSRKKMANPSILSTGDSPSSCSTSSSSDSERMAATAVRKQMYRQMLLSTKVGTAAFGQRKDYTISRHHEPMEVIMELCKGGGGNCECDLQELTTMQQEVKASMQAHAMATKSTVPCFQKILQEERSDVSLPVNKLHYPLINTIELVHKGQYRDGAYRMLWVQCVQIVLTVLCPRHAKMIACSAPSKPEELGGVKVNAYFISPVTPPCTSDSEHSDRTAVCTDKKLMTGCPDYTIMCQDTVICDFEDKKNEDGLSQLIFYMIGHCFMGKREHILGVYAQENLRISLCFAKVRSNKITIYEVQNPLYGIEGLFQAQRAVFEYICSISVD